MKRAKRKANVSVNDFEGRRDDAKKRMRRTSQSPNVHDENVCKGRWPFVRNDGEGKGNAKAWSTRCDTVGGGVLCA